MMIRLYQKLFHLADIPPRTQSQSYHLSSALHHKDYDQIEELFKATSLSYSGKSRLSRQCLYMQVSNSTDRLLSALTYLSYCFVRHRRTKQAPSMTHSDNINLSTLLEDTIATAEHWNGNNRDPEANSTPICPGP